MAKKNSKYPPSQLRYRERNPYVTFNVPINLKNKFEIICKKKGITKSHFIRQFIFDSTATFDDLKKAQAIEIEKVKNDTYQAAYQKGAVDREKVLKEKYDKEIAKTVEFSIKSKKENIWDQGYDTGYSEGYAEGGIINFIQCLNCGESLSMDIHKKEIIELLTRNLRGKLQHSPSC